MTMRLKKNPEEEKVEVGLLEKTSVPFDVKEFSETGEFSGLASPYGNKDLGDDIVEPGAFTKTLAERGDKVPVKDGHGVRIGVASVRDSGIGLEAHGRINLDKQSGRDAYSDLKFYRDNGLPMGLSIGYKAIKSNFDDKGIRHLKEVLLGEISVTEFPMNPEARVTSVKSAADTTVEPAPIPEVKSGRTFSAASKERIKSACAQMKDAHDFLLTLIAEEAAAGDAPGDTPKTEAVSETKSAAEPEAAAVSTEPVDHSLLESLISTLKGN